MIDCLTTSSTWVQRGERLTEENRVLDGVLSQLPLLAALAIKPAVVQSPAPALSTARVASAEKRRERSVPARSSRPSARE
jgi:hypothetical protein